MTIRIVNKSVTKGELQKLAQETFGEMIKVVVDLRRDVLACGGELHTDAQAMLLADGSAAKDLWGFCIYFDRPFVEAFDFTSHINVRAQDGNPSLRIQDEMLRRKITNLVQRLVDWSR